MTVICVVQATNTSSFSKSYILLTFSFLAVFSETVLNHLSGCNQTRPGTLKRSEHSLRGTVCPKPKPFTQNFLMLPFVWFRRVISSSQLDVGQHFHSVTFWPLSIRQMLCYKMYGVAWIGQHSLYKQYISCPCRHAGPAALRVSTRMN